jgi:hypothetical protein
MTNHPNQPNLPKRQDPPDLFQDIQELLDRVDALPKCDLRPESEILGYDDQGIPE